MLGFRRDSTGTAAEGGVTFAITDKLTATPRSAIWCDSIRRDAATGQRIHR